ncbi:MAG: cation:proton antiporter [Anaerolineales bacterium]|nr:cation:proton antiporter [Anaerolineales bacterium]
MTPFLQLALALAVIIAAAKAAGYLSYRLGQPSVLGELLVGVLLGPSVIDLLHLAYFTDSHLPDVIHEMAEMGVLLLMFIAGLDLHLSDLAKTGKVSVFSGVLGVVFPMALGVAVGLLASMELGAAVFLGLVLSATSVSISAQTLMEMRVLRSRVGYGLLGAAVFDDILVILGLSIFSAMAISDSGAGLGDIIVIILRMILFLGGATVIGMLVLPKFSRRIAGLPISQGLVAFTIVIILLFGWGAEEWGRMAAITGAFMAGLVFSRSSVKERIETGISALAYGMFVPIFFIDVGLKADIRQIGGSALIFFLGMTLAAIIGKVLGAGLGASLGGFSRRESLQLGIGMMSRGEVGLIAASLGITQGLITQEIFSAMVGMVVVTTLLTPPLLRLAFRPSQPPKKPDAPIVSDSSGISTLTDPTLDGG